MGCSRIRQVHVCFAILLTLLGGIAAVRAADGAPEIVVTEAWIRWLPANLPAGGYLDAAQ